MAITVYVWRYCPFTTTHQPAHRGARRRDYSAAMRALPVWLCLVLELTGCIFDPTATARATCSPEAPSCPLGFVCRTNVGWCVALDEADRDAPRIVRASLPPTALRRGDTVRVEVDVSEALGLPPTGALTQLRTSNPLTHTDGVELTHHFERVVGEAEVEGLANVSIDLVDVAGNAAQGLLVGAVTLDFSAPTISRFAFVAPAGSDGGAVAVQSAEPIAFRVVFSEPVQPGLQLTARAPGCGADVAFTTTSAVGGLADFVATPPVGQPGCTYTLALSAVADLAGNLATPSPLTLDASYTVDDEGPRLERLVSGRSVDGGFVPATVFSRAAGFDAMAFRFDVAETALTLSATFEGEPLPDCTLRTSCSAAVNGLRSCLCTRPVNASDIEGGALFALTATDAARNAKSSSTPVRFDFTAPRLVMGTVSLALDPPMNSLVPTVTALTLGGQARFGFAIDERGSASLRAQPTALTFVRGSSAGTAFTFTTTPVAPVVEGQHIVTATLTDEVGNTRDEALGVPLLLDTRAPLPPDVLSDGGIVYVRVPWGMADAGVRFDVQFSAGTVEPLATIIATDARGSEAGRGVMSARGDLLLGLSQSDRPVVMVRAVDAAGNASASVEVKDVEWRASLRGKVLGDPATNPHAAERRPFATQQWVQANVTEVLLPLTATTSPQWRLDDELGHRSASAMVYDARRGRVVQYGGNTATGDSEEVFEFDGNAWVNRSPSGTHPVVGHQFAMAYDSYRGKTVLFGGYPNGLTNELWEFDGDVWVNRTPAAGGPMARVYHSMAYDSARRRVVLYGGQGETSTPRDTWEWDGRTWLQRPTTTDPGIRLGATMAYDPRRQKTVLFGGGATNEVWEWNGVTWASVTSTPGPATVDTASLVYDSVRQVLTLFGGRRTAGFTNEVWTWDGTTWTNKTPAAGSPSARGGQLMAFDDARGVAVMTGGIGASGALVDLWEWNGTSWTNRNATKSRPAASVEMAMAYDTDRNAEVLMGATLTASSVWEVSGPTWRNRTDAGIPTPRFGHQLVFDSARHVTLAFGGYPASGPSTNQLWSWNGATWSNLTPTTGPTARHWHMMTYDSARNVALLFGGTTATGNSRELWEWNGTAWANKTPATGGPSARYRGGLAFDSARNVTVLFGGSSGSDELWEWNGTAWNAPVVTGPRPTGRSYFAMGYDPVRRRTVVFGGGTNAGRSDEVWEWDGVRWYDETRSSGGPAPREQPLMAFDVARGAMVSYGGGTSAGFTNELWQWGRQPGDRPQVVVRFRFSSAIASTVWVQSVRAEVNTTGNGFALTNGAATSSVELSLYDDRNAFVPRTTAVGGVALFQSTDTAELTRAFTGAQQELAFSVSPSGADSRQGASQVQVSDAQVVVRYRRP